MKEYLELFHIRLTLEDLPSMGELQEYGSRRKNVHFFVVAEPEYYL